MTQIVKKLSLDFPSDISEIIEEYQQDWIQQLVPFKKKLFNFTIDVEKRLVTEKSYIITENHLSPHGVIPFFTNLGYYVSRKGDPNYCISLFPFDDEEYSMYPQRPRIHQYIKIETRYFISHLQEPYVLPIIIPYTCVYRIDMDYSIQGWETIKSLLSKELSKELKKKGLKAIFDDERQVLTIEHETFIYSPSWIKDYKFYKKRKLE